MHEGTHEGLPLDARDRRTEAAIEIPGPTLNESTRADSIEVYAIFLNRQIEACKRSMDEQKAVDPTLQEFTRTDPGAEYYRRQQIEHQMNHAQRMIEVVDAAFLKIPGPMREHFETKEFKELLELRGRLEEDNARRYEAFATFLA